MKVVLSKSENSVLDPMKEKINLMYKIILD